MFECWAKITHLLATSISLSSLMQTNLNRRFDCDMLLSPLRLLRRNRQDFGTLKDITLRTFYDELRAGGVVRVSVLRYARVHARVGDARVAYRQRVV